MMRSATLLFFTDQIFEVKNDKSDLSEVISLFYMFKLLFHSHTYPNTYILGDAFCAPTKIHSSSMFANYLKLNKNEPL